MKLSEREFKVVNSPLLRFLQKHIEFPIFRKMGLDPEGKSILEIGCGSGYAAFLIYSGWNPENYIGIDLMPEQLALAKKLDLAQCKFMEMDATDLSYFPDNSKDIILICRILHHIPQWKNAVKECYRVLRPGGMLFTSEPYRAFTKITDSIINIGGHPDEAQRTLPAQRHPGPPQGQPGRSIRYPRRFCRKSFHPEGPVPWP